MKRAIITGPTGAIGTALIRNLISKKIEILVFTRKDSSRNGNIPENDLVKIRYCSLAEISQMENDTGKQYDVFYHLAWAGASGPGRNDRKLQDDNVRYALDALECANRFGCRKFIGIGSQAEYGRKKVDLTADLDCHPENEYGRAKLETGKKAAVKAKQLGMEFNWVRVLSIYGVNDGANSLISYTIRTLLKHEAPELTEGQQIWDYLFSEDAAQALYQIGEKGVDGKTYVLGSGKTKKLREYIEIIRDIIAPEIEPLFGFKPYPEKQVMYLKADISELTDDTGWRPETDFKDGIVTVIDSFRSV